MNHKMCFNIKFSIRVNVKMFSMQFRYPGCRDSVMCIRMFSMLLF